MLPGHCSNWIRRVVCRKRRWQFFCLLQNIVGHLRMRALLCSLCRQPASRLSWQYQPIRSGDCPSTEQEDVKSLTLGHTGTWRMHERLQPSWGRDSGPSTHSLSSCVCVCVFVWVLLSFYWNRETLMFLKYTAWRVFTIWTHPRRPIQEDQETHPPGKLVVVMTFACVSAFYRWNCSGCGLLTGLLWFSATFLRFICVAVKSCRSFILHVVQIQLCERSTIDLFHS